MRISVPHGMYAQVYRAQPLDSTFKGKGVHRLTCGHQPHKGNGQPALRTSRWMLSSERSLTAVSDCILTQKNPAQIKHNGTPRCRIDMTELAIWVDCQEVLISQDDVKSIWSRWRELNPRPTPYQGVAIPLSHSGLCTSALSPFPI